MTGEAASRRWFVWSCGYAAIAALATGYFVLRVPIQVTDSFTSLLALDRPFLDLMRDQFQQAGYLRPGLWAEMKLVYDLSGGDFYHWFRMTQALQVAGLIWLFVRLVQPRSLISRRRGESLAHVPESDVGEPRV